MPIPFFLHRLLTFGRRSEILAANYLRSLGYRVVSSGFRTRNGEVDLVAWDGDVLVFVEVKSRQSSDPPEDAVNQRKRERIARAAHSYILRHHHQNTPRRFDIVAVTSMRGRKPSFRLLRDAFRA
jgi:putative endonuclease